MTKNTRLPQKPLLFCIALATLGAAQPANAQSANPPNIVVIFADDLGPGDVNTYHKERTGKASPIPTPTMDTLIESGMRFDDAHAPNSLCAPSRFSMLTGKPLTERHEFLMHQSQNGPSYAIRQGELKLIMRAQSKKNLKGLKPTALFNLKDNPLEKEEENLLKDSKHKMTVDQLFKTYLELRKTGQSTIGEK